jgi:VIT1/CCC1 family predicted Fe2+/Mn2+ transporter
MDPRPSEASSDPSRDGDHLERSNTLRAAVFGVQDGIVSTFGLVMGVVGARISPEAVVIAGIAGLISGALSMGAGEYVSVRFQQELLAVRVGLVGRAGGVDPIRAAAANAGLFVVGGLLPLLPFLLTTGGARAVTASVTLSVLALFLTGAGLTRLTRSSPLRSGLRMLVIGGGAGLLGYGVGSLLGVAVG